MSCFRQVKIFIAVIALIILLTVSPQSVSAVSIPDFGSCLNPQVVATQINNGNSHGVVGQNTPYSGQDSIYNLSNGNVLQCLCTIEGSGVQTNWLKAAGLSQEETSSLKAQGWIYIPTGASWGLEDVAYVAKNISYSCKSNQPTPTPGIQAAVAAIQPGILGLAATGNAVALYSFVLAGLFSLLVGLLLKKTSK